MANFLIAVGGTGQNVAMAYYRFCELCGYEPAKIYVMDSDTSISREQSAFIPIKPFPTPPCIEERQQNSFNNLFNPSGNPDVDSVLSVLFTTEELETPINLGMFGKPPIGSTTIMDKIVIMENDNTEDERYRRSDENLYYLLQALKTSGTHKVVICGSALGGTGSGGVPAFAQYIAAQKKRYKDEFNAEIKIIIIYFLSHFNIEPPLFPDLKPYERIQTEQLITNAQSGMCYLADEITKGVDACVLLGLEDSFIIPFERTGQQTEKKYFIYLLAAIIANNAFCVPELADYFPKIEGEKIFSYWIPVEGETSTYLVSDIMVYLPGGKLVSLDKIPKLAKATVAFLEIFAKYINPLPRYSFFPLLITPPKLKEAVEMLKREKSEKTILKEISDSIKDYTSKIKKNLEWFEDLLSNETKIGKSAILSLQNTSEKITITEEVYKKTEQRPMPFLRKVIENTNWEGLKSNRDKAVDNFVKNLVIGTKRTIDSDFLQSSFKDVQFIG